MISLDFTKIDVVGALKLLAEHEWAKDFSFFLHQYSENQLITVKSSGSTGSPKTLRFSADQYRASAKKSIKYFSLIKGQNVFLALPGNTVGGQLMLLRAVLAKMNIVLAQPSVDAYTHVKKPIDFAPMVYSQLKHLLDHNTDALKLYKNILLGGAPVPESFIKNCKKHPVQFYASYGMTETLSHVAISDLSHKAHLGYQILDGNTLSIASDGCINIQCDYLPEKIITTDFGEINDGFVRVFGRKDFVIISSGKKIHPEEIEKVLSHFIKQLFIVGPISDAGFGNILGLMTENELSDSEKNALEDYNKNVEPHKRIRKYLTGRIFSNNQKLMRAKTLKHWSRD